MCRKLAMLLLLAVSGLTAMAISGDGKNRNTNPNKRSLLTNNSVNTGSFSLRSSYNFRGNRVISNTNANERRYVTLNTTVSYQSGSTSYIVPLKKKVILNDKVVFNPNAKTRN